MSDKKDLTGVTLELGVGSVVEKALDELLRPPHFYSVCSPYNSTAILGRRAREADYRMWQSALPAELDDVELVIAGLQAATGHGARYITTALYAHLRLRELPVLTALQEQMFHLDLNRLKAIDNVLCRLHVAHDDQLPWIDEQLTAFVTPTKPNQNLPTPKEIRTFLHALLTSLDVPPPPTNPPPDDGYLDITVNGDQGTIICGTDAVTANEVDERVRRHAQRNNISETAALIALIRGEGRTDIHLNLYRASDLEDAPAWLDGVGWITPEQADSLMGQVTLTRDMDETLDKISTAYVTPDDIRAAVVGLDGTCSMPDCPVHGHRAQMDHRINHDDGGATTSSNLAALCPRHHNIKTDQRVIYLIDPFTREKYFLFEDGRWVTSEPTGPLAPKQRRWLQTVAQRVEKRRARRRGEPD